MSSSLRTMILKSSKMSEKGASSVRLFELLLSMKEGAGVSPDECRDGVFLRTSSIELLLVGMLVFELRFSIDITKLI